MASFITHVSVIRAVPSMRGSANMGSFSVRLASSSADVRSGRRSRSHLPTEEFGDIDVVRATL
eukprot:6013993-Prymnesium_polylepis.1